MIFLFLVTHKCTGHPDREKRERLDREQFRERDTEAKILAVARRGAEEQQKVTDTKKGKRTRQEEAKSRSYCGENKERRKGRNHRRLQTQKS